MKRYALLLVVIGFSPAMLHAAPADFDGDGKTDVSVIRIASGTGTYNWYILQSQTNTLRAEAWGSFNDRAIPSDFDGDGKTDIAIWRPSSPASYYILRSTNNSLMAIQWGSSGDMSRINGDFDNDGKDDPCVVRNLGGPYVWHILLSASNSYFAIQWGRYAGALADNDVPISGDYDGDGMADVGVYRLNTPSGTQGTYFIRRSSNGTLLAQEWGSPNVDYLVPGDYDGDGKTDFAVFRGLGPGTNGYWYILQSSTGSMRAEKFGIGGNGLAGDLPVPGDYDADGKSDLAVIRRGSNNNTPLDWYINRSFTGTLQAQTWGLGSGEGDFGSDFAVPLFQVRIYSDIP